MVVHTGGCHCGAVRYEVDAPADLEAQLCNCSICSMTAYLHLIVPRARFRLLQGAGDLETYTFNTGVARHMFCKHCGIKSFYVPRSNPRGISVNVRCLQPDTIGRVMVRSFDGRNWELHAHELAHLADEPQEEPPGARIGQAVTITIRSCVDDQQQAVLDLLTAADLPTADLTSDRLRRFLVATNDEGRVIGAVGLELFGQAGLLRSLVVHPSLRDSGVGRRLVDALTEAACREGARELYLLTTTAATFFSKLGYTTLPRDNVPESIAGTSEFRSLCPATAVCLHKRV